MSLADIGPQQILLHDAEPLLSARSPSEGDRSAAIRAHVRRILRKLSPRVTKSG
ncbi:hypothetical protein J2X36_000567 [Methylobacterium sp. BE186]|nr:hypothetical protein [Methylobacterium sp. BE186]